MHMPKWSKVHSCKDSIFKCIQTMYNVYNVRKNIEVTLGNVF